MTTPDPYTTWLAGRTDAELTALLRARPDAAYPPPPTIGSLAARLTIRTSVAHALAQLNTPALMACDIAAAAGAEYHPVAYADIVAAADHACADFDSADLDSARDALFTLGLWYGDPQDPRQLAEVMATLPADWDLRAEATATPAPTLRTDIAALDDTSRAILETLARSGGTGTTRDADPDAEPTRPIPRLIAAGLIQRINSTTVRLPRHVRAAITSEDLVALSLQPPTLPAPTPATNDDAGVTAGLSTVRDMAQLIDALSLTPARLLRDHGVGVREIGRLAGLINDTPDECIRLCNLGLSAGLIATGQISDTDTTEYLAPTPAADEWLSATPAARWAHLLVSWWDSAWDDAAVGDAHLATPATRNAQLPVLRHAIADACRTAPQAVRLPHSDVAALLGYPHPRLSWRTPVRAVARTLASATSIGAFSDGTLTPVVEGLLAADPEAVARATTAATPPSVDYLIVQADMTVTAPGPLNPETDRELTLLADLESPGLASVYRITQDSLRRAFDAGRTAADIHAWLRAHCRGEVPSAVSYLVDDLARTHGTLRGGPAGSYVRCADPAQLAQALGLPIAADLHLRGLAPTVAVSDRPLAEVITALRGEGITIAAEDSEGRSIDLRPEPARISPGRRRRDRGAAGRGGAGLGAASRGAANAPARGPAHAAAGAVPDFRTPTAPDPQRIAAAIAALRRDTSGGNGNQGATQRATNPITQLKAAARAGKAVRLGYVDSAGGAHQMNITPVRVAEGHVEAVALSDGAARRFSLHRVTSVETLD